MKGIKIAVILAMVFVLQIFGGLFFMGAITGGGSGSGGAGSGGGGHGSQAIVETAMSQLGEQNNGGQKFWSYAGFPSRVSWCAAYVSWCANENGYIESGIIPKSAWCNDFRTFAKARDQWKDGMAHGGSYIPKKGDLILFQWGGSTGADLDHIGIVTDSDGVTVSTVEGNSGDAVKCNFYPIGSPFIIGYFSPAYPGNSDSGSNSGTGDYGEDQTAYTQAEMELIYAVIQQEDNGSYEGALAVISTVMNRVESEAWGSCGSNALEQIKAPGQFCYSIDTNWHQWLGGNVYAHVKQAVDDCLKKGIRNHEYTRFRSTQGSVTGSDGKYIPDERGNYYF